MKRSITTRKEMNQVAAARDEFDLLIKVAKMVDAGQLELYGSSKALKEGGITSEDMIALRPLMEQAIITLFKHKASSIKANLENDYGFLLDTVD